MKIMKKLLMTAGVVSVLVMSMMLTACPQQETTTTAAAPQIDEAVSNSAASGISQNVTVKGEIDGTDCDIVLNASTGTFTAKQASRAAEVTFSGEFFYADGKLKLNVQYRGDADISLYYEANVSDLADNTSVTFTEITETVYTTAKTAFVNDVKADYKSLLSQIDASLKDEVSKITFSFTLDSMTVGAFGSSFTVTMAAESFAADDSTPAWFKTVFMYIQHYIGLYELMNGDTVSTAKFMAEFKDYGNITAVMMKLSLAFDEFKKKLADNVSAEDKAVIDAAETELSKYTDYSFSVSYTQVTTDTRITVIPVMRITFMGSDATAAAAECNLTMSETISADKDDFVWLTNLVSIVISDETLDLSKHSAAFAYMSTKTKTMEFVEKLIASMPKGDGKSDILTEYQTQFEAAERVLTGYLNSTMTVEPSFGTSADSAEMKITIGEPTDSANISFTYNLEPNAVQSDDVPAWFSDLYPAIASIMGMSAGQGSDGEQEDFMRQLSSAYPGVAKLTEAVASAVSEPVNAEASVIAVFIADKAQELAAAEDNLANYVNDMTADLSSDLKIYITIGSGVSFSLALADPAVSPFSDDTPEWFSGVFTPINALMHNETVNIEYADIADELSEDYAGVAALVRKLGAEITKLESGDSANTGN